jgi:alpha-tubulin suppressor-like RCC1 family protein
MKTILCFLILLLFSSCENAKRNNPLDASANNFRDPFIITMPDTTVAIKDSFFVHVLGVEKNGRITKYRWSLDEKVFFDSTDDGLIKVAWSDSGKKKIFVEAIDDIGFHFPSPLASINILVKLYAPTVLAMADTAVWIKDTLKLHANASDQNGTVNKYLWALNGSSFSDSSNTSSFNTSFPTSGLKTVLVKVRDDDGVYSAFASFKVNVKLGAPIILPVPDTTVWINDSLKLQVAATDSNGTVVKYLWAMNGTGFLDSSEVPYINGSYSAAGLKTVLVKVRDDDQIFSQSTSFKVNVKLGAPILAHRPDTSVWINDSLKLYVSATDSNGTVVKYFWAVNGSSFMDSSDGASHTTAFSTPGLKSVLVKVKDDDGLFSNVDTIKINVKVKNANADLSALVLSAGTLSPVFNKNDTTYSVAVANEVAALTVTPFAVMSTTSSITINGIAVASGAPSGNIPMIIGTNPIILVVKAESGITKTYTIISTRDKNSNANLSELVLSIGKLNPGFAAKDTVYTFSVANSIQAITITPIAAAVATSKITINDSIAVSGSASRSIPLALGKNQLIVTVTAQNGNAKTYTLIATRVPSDWAYLSDLTVSAGSLSPIYNDTVLAYTLSVEYPVTKTTIKATLLDSTKATIRVNGTMEVNGTLIVSGLPSDSISLAVGSKTIPVVVTLDGGQAKTYSITMTRNPPGSIELTGLSLSAGILNPPFSKSTTSYSLTTSLPTTTVTATVLAPLGANIKVNGTLVNSGLASESIPLGFEPNSISVQVISNDGTSKTTTILVNKIPTISRLVAGAKHSLILKTDGTLWATGANDSGQLGDGTTINRKTPVLIMSGVAKMAAGASHTIILKTDKTVWSTGYNFYGQLGDGTTTDRKVPVQIMAGVTNIAAGYMHSLILKSDGTLWATGNNLIGQLGDGSTTNRKAPVQIMTGVDNMAAGSYHTLILKTDGTLWATGDNFYGQLGDGTSTNHSTPIQIMAAVTNMASGSLYSLILKSDKTLWVTGNNSDGQLGDGTIISRNTFAQVVTGVANIAAGGFHTLILRTDGTLWATGFNGNGRLGDGTTTDRISPIQIMAGVADMAAGGFHTLILKTDGTIWNSGSNINGQLGDGTNSDRLVPTKIAF